MKIDENTQEKLNLIQVHEQNLQTNLSQKQNIQTQLVETDSALLELDKSKKAYKIVGNIMVASDISGLKKEISSKKEMFEVRIKSIEKQEDKIKEKISELQKDVMSSMKK